MTSAEARPEVVVSGCGVSGLTSGIRLLEKGFRIKIITEEKAFRVIWQMVRQPFEKLF